jgi:predicted RND superfamily exporter protein
MLHPDFKNAQNLDLHSALAIFIVMMGLLFYIDAAAGTHSIMALLTIVLGLAWYAGHKALFRFVRDHWH